MRRSYQGKNNPFFGKKHSEESREKNRQAHLGVKLSEEIKNKISKALTGRKISKETKRKIGKGNKGKIRSNKTKEKISITKTGQYLTDETKLRMSLARSGSGNAAWKGGITNDPYCSGWQQLSKELKEDDNNRCQNPLCKGVSQQITSHHIDYDKEHCHPDNLITLCNSCNVKANSNRDWWQVFYTEIKKRKEKF